ncbi:uncharacterized protein CIMG_03145 [Coccidioides immitis RS]|uniref:Uncharacterized protein n=4 Tax=Coccidioides immitis TaxID=5501 RepID=J3KAQ3_COCIM|nr:uncharacterized protein CIMG_03145 [Coccidioides immitis RS]EAS32121.3 hypothetical protein CIMG_03145 [Coccidioides immitis RS]KMP07318.1 hypothetical protein CIRG_06999 [Coccidioides immitis RMSCC 2394]KMU72229.1 hypothetical protein CISG_00538 [Coccidioides immitis RMSCC 3703]KMU82397.1 hypothetical protein CIHG_00180 [Coccidioides immitis H538.4]
MANPTPCRVGLRGKSKRGAVCVDLSETANLIKASHDDNGLLPSPVNLCMGWVCDPDFEKRFDGSNRTSFQSRERYSRNPITSPLALAATESQQSSRLPYGDPNNMKETHRKTSIHGFVPSGLGAGVERGMNT